ncbi:hypothetical protein [Salinarimonas soli]|uniref:Uncharacterized protein n=1 Tax=Salinarimonas soli TaxID=1638099 RepID=A0A5B2V7P8_9HYPH|nr:hypothetical protein [Salinarimonas soli]KAA2235563.1 hypothetical protein F0L46_18845 [Salinarimonas soli]
MFGRKARQEIRLRNEQERQQAAAAERAREWRDRFDDAKDEHEVVRICLEYRAEIEAEAHNRLSAAGIGGGTTILLSWIAVVLLLLVTYQWWVE